MDTIGPWSVPIGMVKEPLRWFSAAALAALSSWVRPSGVGLAPAKQTWYSVDMLKSNGWKQMATGKLSISMLLGDIFALARS